jgi:hypothetical protein
MIPDEIGLSKPRVNLTRLRGNVEKAASTATDLERQLATKSSGCTFVNKAAEKIDKEIPLAATATENALMVLLVETKARLRNLNDEDNALDWTGWRGSREEAISELTLLSHDIATTVANADLAFARLKNTTIALDRSSATCR